MIEQHYPNDHLSKIDRKYQYDVNLLYLRNLISTYYWKCESLFVCSVFTMERLSSDIFDENSYGRYMFGTKAKNPQGTVG